ncbi:MAG: AAA family ATPase [Candidatus Cloacimonadales bacterium]|nr:AAA family ATPase [Candidatus Cloacimonadales bacterium]
MNRSNLKKISIYGLFNKYDLTLEFKNIVKVIIAENGSGKTTLLNIIVCVLIPNRYQ